MLEILYTVLSLILKCHLAVLVRFQSALTRVVQYSSLTLKQDIFKKTGLYEKHAQGDIPWSCLIGSPVDDTDLLWLVQWQHHPSLL